MMGLVGPGGPCICGQHRLRPRDRFACTRQYLPYFSNRPPSWETIDYFFEQKIERKRINGDQIFVRATAYERHFRCRASAHSSIFFWNVIALGAMSELADWRFSFRFRFRFFFFMFLYQAKNNTALLLPQTTIRPKRPQVKTVPYCTYPSRVESVQYTPRKTPS